MKFADRIRLRIAAGRVVRELGKTRKRMGARAKEIRERTAALQAREAAFAAEANTYMERDVPIGHRLDELKDLAQRMAQLEQERRQLAADREVFQREVDEFETIARSAVAVPGGYVSASGT